MSHTKLYDCLETTKNATVNDIKKSFRKLALKWHPDKWSSKSEKEKNRKENTYDSSFVI